MQAETKVTQVLSRTKDALSIRFARPTNFIYQPGQYMFVTLFCGDEPKTKHLTISSSPTENFLEITKKLTGHEFSNALEKVKTGDTVMIRGPYGDFTFQGEYDRICMISGGIGITPLRSMIRYSTDKKLSSNIILLYSNSHEDGIVFKEDLENMAKQNSNIKIVNTITKPSPAWKGFIGRIDADMIIQEVPDYANRIFFASGPRKMVETILVLLRDLGLSESKLKHEYFPGYD